jgi:hypothetical protein
MEGVGVTSRHVTLKLKRRKNGAKPPPKFLGHGSCHNLSKGMGVPGSIATRDTNIIRDVGMTLFNELAVPLDDVRGMGIIMSKLNHRNGSDKGSSSGISGWLSKGLESGLQAKERQSASGLVAGDFDESNNDSSLFASDTHGDSQHGNRKNDLETTSLDHGAAQNALWSRVDEQVDDTIPRSTGNKETGTALLASIDSDGRGLPEVSQIRLSQLEALPADIRQEIESRMEEVSRMKSQKGKEVHPVEQANGNAALHNTIDLTRAVGKTLDSNDIDDSADHDAALRLARFRQMDLKRLMKLAAVKSGKFDTGISLTELDHLPLEIKLQVVNQDSCPVGVLSQRKQAQEGSRHLPVVEEENRHESPNSVRKEIAAANVSDGSFDRGVVCGDGVRSVENLGAEQDTKVLEDSIVPMPKGPENLYEEDVLPLKLFLDENEPTNQEAVDQVTQFLSICMREGRVGDVATVVRSIRNRGDEWSAKGVLRTVTFTLNQEHRRITGSRLDVDWLLGDN